MFIGESYTLIEGEAPITLARQEHFEGSIFQEPAQAKSHIQGNLFFSDTGFRHRARLPAMARINYNGLNRKGNCLTIDGPGVRERNFRFGSRIDIHHCRYRSDREGTLSRHATPGNEMRR